MKYCYMSDQEGFNKTSLNMLSNQVFKCRNKVGHMNDYQYLKLDSVVKCPVVFPDL